ncbi:cell envelope integrity protein TolA [Erwinia sp. 9145]|uniref:cell envelope integrity protein TolA n=1 Tax=Erwinia sp. 9145 TaxID=1500895 RepID=UPI00068FAD8A|nr:cell envelope integrity protein TolA [Erwinia sp. 9145]
MRTGIIGIAMVLAGCQSVQDGKTPPDAQAIQAAADKACRHETSAKKGDCVYFAKMQYAIQRNFNEADRYHGRECLVTVGWSGNGRYSVKSTNGDEALCLKAWSVIGSADDLPPPPENLPGEMVLEFKPEK